MPLDDPNKIDFELRPVVRNKEFDPTRIEQKLGSGETSLALLLASTKVELIMAETVKMVLGLDDKRYSQVGFDTWSLGTYLHRVESLNRLNREEINHYRLSDLVTKWNKLAHDDGYATILEEDENEIKEVINILEKVVEFIEDVIIDERRNSILPDG